MEFKDLHELKTELSPAVVIDGGLIICDAEGPPAASIDRLVRTAVFSSDPGLRDVARFVIRQTAAARGACVASIQPLYQARGRGECSGFTVPAINIRGMTYDVARAAIRAAMSLRVGALIFEIARSEIGYTRQRPAEYATAVLAAALRESWRGPVFLQGDHYQVNAKKFAREPDSERDAIKSLIEESIPAGFLNIDIDASTVVDLSRPDVDQQQRLNFELTAWFTRLIRQKQPAGVTISVGGEIGEVGGKNSTPEELRVFMNGYLAELRTPAGTDGLAGISKISIQTGTTHGGIPLPDGRIAEVKIDFDVLRALSRIAREEYGLAGAVQHGASTLHEEAFDHFPPTGTAEIHLATGFQNMIYDHPSFPDPLRREIHLYLEKTCAEERKEGMTDEQFLYKTRKKAFGPFKKQLWDLPAGVREAITRDLEARFALLYRKLAVTDTAEMVANHVPLVTVPAPLPAHLAGEEGGRTARR